MHIKVPSNHNVKIWRYLDFAKFMSMLDQNSLFFSNLSDLDDPYEGMMPNSVREKYKHYFRNAARKTDQRLPLENESSKAIQAVSDAVKVYSFHEISLMISKSEFQKVFR